MRRCAPSVMLMALLLAACEHVDAPKALQIADKAEDKLWDEWMPQSIQTAGEGNFYEV